MSLPTVHVDFGDWEPVEFQDRADVGQLPHTATCACGVSLRDHFDSAGHWRSCALAFRPVALGARAARAARAARVHEKVATVPQCGGVGGR
jgi:hypothetical protein